MNANFQKFNNILGWVVFAIALLTYWITMEPTASYWDCGEFISVSYKLEVPHPPGAPLFLLIGRLFSLLAFGDTAKVAYWINFSSVLASAFTILFLFWSITLFGRKLMKINKPEEMTNDKIWVLMGAGLVGALACTFSDSAWFSAVEGEVYGMSSFFTAFVVWAMLKWDLIEDDAQANRWLLLIFYMMGLSIGIHMLNLVTIPALSLIYYFKKYKQPSLWGVVAAMVISLVIILFINDFIVPGLPTIAGHFEVFFVNTLRMPFNSGVIVFVLIIVVVLIWGIWRTQKKQAVLLNTFLLATAFILIGYASYTLVVIRSNFETPINEDDPSDVMSFVSYLKREQYGSRPLLYGQYFTAELQAYDQGAPIYAKGKDRYIEKDRKVTPRYDDADMTFMPRIYSTDPEHQRIYRSILGLQPGEHPTKIDNFRYMFTHQIGWMYVRYFFFNFAGRESDIQNADWMSPNKWFEKIPQALKENKGRNNFFMIPFILGLIGLFYQIVYDSRNFIVVGLLFVLMGVALVVYLNSPPTEPRERDYIYAGSYYAYCFWIGFAVIAIAETLKKVFNNLKTAAVVATLLCLSAPALMAKDGWDDHDRSKRYFSVDSAINYLQSCAPDAILFTGGDNDTFPLWYAQEVEGVRTDVRVVVLSYYNTDWYIKQTMHKVYESDAFPYTLTLDNYRQGGPNDYLPFYDLKIKNMDLNQYLSLLKKDYEGLRVYPSANVLPTKNIILPIDVDKIRSMHIVPADMDSLIVPAMRLQLRKGRGGLEKKDLAMLDVLATNNWQRPIYVNNTSMSQFNVDLTPYAVQEGNAYRILPVFNKNPQLELVNTDVCYKNMTEKFQYRGLDDSTIYYTQDYRNFVLNQRSSVNALAEALIAKGDTAKARETILFSLKKMPDAAIRYDYTTAQTVGLLLEVGEKEKAIQIATLMGKRAEDMAQYLLSKGELDRELQINVVILGELQRVLYKYGEGDLAKKFEEAYEKYGSALRMGGDDE